MGQVHPVARSKRTVRQTYAVDGPSYDDVDYDDASQVADAHTQRLRENYLRGARMHVLQDSIAICYNQHSVNHKAKCRPLYIEYCRQLELLGAVKVNIPELHPVEGKEPAHEEKKEGEGQKEAGE